MDEAQIVTPDGVVVEGEEAELIRASHEENSGGLDFQSFVTQWFSSSCTTPVCGIASDSGVSPTQHAVEMGFSEDNDSKAGDEASGCVQTMTPPASVHMEAAVPVIDAAPSSSTKEGKQEIPDDVKEFRSLATEMIQLADNLAPYTNFAAVSTIPSAPALESVPEVVDVEGACASVVFPVPPDSRVVPTAAIDELCGAMRGTSLASLYDGERDVSENAHEAETLLVNAATSPTFSALSLPTIFISRMEDAWNKFVNASLENATQPYMASGVAQAAAVDFIPIVNTLTEIGRGRGIAVMAANYRILASVATIVMRTSIVAFMSRQNAAPYKEYMRTQLEQLLADSKPTTPLAEPILISSDSLLKATTLKDKIILGIATIMNNAREKQDNSEVTRSATNNTFEFMTPFVERAGRSKIGDKTFAKDTAALFASAMYGLVLMRRLNRMPENLPGLQEIRDDYVAGLNLLTLQIFN